MKIKLTQTTNIPAGVALRLSDAQASARAHVLEPDAKSKGVYLPLHTVQFKAGEVLDIVGDLPKGLLPVYDQARQKKPDKPEKAKPPEASDEGNDGALDHDD